MKVLFVCIENACRSQMAEAFYNKYSKNSMASSAGSNPSEHINPLAIQVMNEIGIELKNQKPVGYAPFLNEIFDVIITMGCKEECPITPLKKTIKWDIPDPKGKNIEEFRKTREIIKSKVIELLRLYEK